MDKQEKQTNEKHLEFLQGNITRMNQCSFQMKGWAIAIVSALLAIFAGTISETCSGNKTFIFISIMPTVLFWFLDAYYLSQERKFVAMYNDVAQITHQANLKDYEINLKIYKGWRYCLINTMLSVSTILLYGTIIVGLILMGILL